ncbi:hypothetical protein D9758_006958 [Tetrapyrgos nigripes]|uniref:Uncharacterized protein n=1 Tax=Tetrapyrgos nigripes TaxID=182062 RepID=A0A8H5GSR8_9AGAR|nr:hypothetical protein D9758_006958 [Tetrapyrgos nigripes]
MRPTHSVLPLSMTAKPLRRRHIRRWTHVVVSLPSASTTSPSTSPSPSPSRTSLLITVIVMVAFVIVTVMLPRPAVIADMTMRLTTSASAEGTYGDGAGKRDGMGLARQKETIEDIEDEDSGGDGEDDYDTPTDPYPIQAHSIIHVNLKPTHFNCSRTTNVVNAPNVPQTPILPPDSTKTRTHVRAPLIKSKSTAFCHLLFYAWPDYGVPEQQDLDGSVRLVRVVDLVNRIPLMRLDRSRSLHADGGKIVGRGEHDGGNIKSNAWVDEVRERQSRDGGHSGDVEMKSGEANTHGVDVNLRRKKYERE